MEEQESRIRALETWRVQVEGGVALDELRRAHMDERFDRVDSEIKAMKGAVNKVLGAVGLLVLGAVTKFVLDGGLNFVQ